MDEPVSNLDIAHQLDIMRLLRQASDKTILIVIHDLNLALQFCDDILLFHQGKLLFHGPVDRLKIGFHTFFAELLFEGGFDRNGIHNGINVYGVSTHLAENRIIFDY